MAYAGHRHAPYRRGPAWRRSGLSAVGAGSTCWRSLLTFAAGLSLLVGDTRRRQLCSSSTTSTSSSSSSTRFVGFTTSLFSASYIGHEIETGRLTPRFVRFYHAMFQAMMGAMNAGADRQQHRRAVGRGRTGDADHRRDGRPLPHAAGDRGGLEILHPGSVGISLAFFGTILIYLAGQPVLGEGVPAMTWSLLQARRRGSSLGCSISPSSSCWSATAPRSVWRRCMPGCPMPMPKARRRSRRCCRACCSTWRSMRCCASRC